MKQMISSPVKQFALEHGLPVLQPGNLKAGSFLNTLAALHADLQVVVAFRMLPAAVWNMPPKGTINLHGSLLPAYRGAAPIQWAIIRGESETGITTFRLQHEIDTGGILLQYKLPILEEDNASTLHDRMMHAGAGLMLATVDLLASSNPVAVAQQDALSSHAPKLTRENTNLHWDQKAAVLHDMIRGLSPHPGAWTMLDGQELKIFKTKKTAAPGTDKPGTLQLADKQLLVNTADGKLEILELQLTGKRRMKTGEFLNGYRIRDWSLT
jgi:methionyl-tRNA formyltransferase